MTLNVSYFSMIFENSNFKTGTELEDRRIYPSILRIEGYTKIIQKNSKNDNKHNMYNLLNKCQNLLFFLQHRAYYLLCLDSEMLLNAYHYTFCYIHGLTRVTIQLF